MEDLKTVETVDQSPFKRMCMTIGELPASFVDSMTYYECLAWLVNYLEKTVIPTVNNNAEELQAVIDYLKDLDLQDEVDTKLDEMAESGELAEIISQYLNSTAIFGFDNVADMKAAPNLIDGSYARTLGYYAKNDGGAGLYKIRNITNDDVVDEAFIIEMDDDSNQLIAELIFGTEVNANQLGAYGDGTHDDTTAIQTGINKLATLSNKGTLKLLSKTYLVGNITLKQNVNIIGEGRKQSKLYAKAEITGYLINASDWNGNWHTCRDFEIDGNRTANTLAAAIYIDKGASHEDSSEDYDIFENLYIHNVYGDGIYNGRGGRGNRFINITISWCDGYGVNAKSSDAYYEAIVCYNNKKAGIYANCGACHFLSIKTYLNGRENTSDSRGELSGFFVDGTNNIFTNCEAQENYGDGFYIKLWASNNTFANCIADGNGMKVYHTPPMLDTDLLYDGFHVEDGDGRVENLQITGIVSDHRRTSNRQLQRYGIYMGTMQSSVVIVSAWSNYAPVYYAGGWSININYYSNNYVQVNGKISGTSVADGLTVKNIDNSNRGRIDIFADTDNTKKMRITSNGSQQISFDYLNGSTYVDSPMTVTLSSNGDGTFYIGDYANHYNLKVRPKTLAFFGAAGAAQQNAITDSTDLASVITLANGLKDVLQAYGLMKAD